MARAAHLARATIVADEPGLFPAWAHFFYRLMCGLLEGQNHPRSSDSSRQTNRPDSASAPLVSVFPVPREHAALHCAVRGEEVHNGHNDEIAFGGLCSLRMPSANILAVASILAAISWHHTELTF